MTEKGQLYSDTYSHAALKKIGKRIKYAFWSPGRYAWIVWKMLFIVKFFTFVEGLSIILSAPRIIASALLREHRRGRLKESIRRTFFNSSNDVHPKALSSSSDFFNKALSSSSDFSNKL